MLLRLLLLVTIFFTMGNYSHKKVSYRKDYYRNGVLRSESWTNKNGKIDYWKFYHSNGLKSQLGHYDNNKRENYWYFYLENGSLDKEGHYLNGKMTKWWLFYNKNGRVNHKCQLSRGVKNGYCLKYKDEKLISAEKHDNGKKIKVWYNLGSFKSENKISDLR